MIKLLQGDCRSILPTLPDASVHCVVTSPPYYGLRDYGTGTWEGGDPACSHVVGEIRTGLGMAALGEQYRGGGKKASEPKLMTAKDVCPHCGARRIDRQIGLEKSPEDWLAALVGVFREVRRILRPDGVLWLNVGDSYNSSPSGPNPGGFHAKHAEASAIPFQAGRAIQQVKTRELKPKDLMMMPARLAIALQADGWWLRSDIIWAKPNRMPESCNDRPTSAHEHIFLLTKAARYFYDSEAVKEPMKDVSLQRLSQPNVFDQPGGPKDSGEGNRSHRKALNNQAERLVRHEKWKTRFEGWDAYDKSLGRNLRNVWEIATQPFPGSHFATMPTELVSRCIRAGTSERGCCAACAAPWVRSTEKGTLVPTRQQYDKRAYGVAIDNPDPNDAGRNRYRDGHRCGMAFEHTTTGWTASCKCDAGVVPCVVLDPFFGSGTVGLVCDRLGRDAIGIDLSAQYNAMAVDRITDDAPLLAIVERSAEAVDDGAVWATRRLQAAPPPTVRSRVVDDAPLLNWTENQVAAE